MSTNEDGSEFIINVIKKVLENRQDITLNDNSIKEMASRMLLKTPALQIMSELRSLNRKYTRHLANVRQLNLKKSIELLALVTHEIDYQAFRQDAN